MQFFAGVLVGQRGGVVCVEVEENTRVGILRRAFIDEVNRDDKEKRIQCPADNVELFVAQVDGAWLPSRDERVQQLTIGEIPEDIQDILVGYPLDPTSSIRDICNGSTPEKTIQILIVPPPRSVEKASIGQLETVAPQCVHFNAAS
ncbi:Crinkler (CRN) family protein [Phytophthora palmivora]|uniref:Crinkler (CRN) family protein n=1 Tax=Phytophthora palmivora TaxID=4796 RepID=A0A2P4X9E8_9STRA|nr:Crinkler (CRN) family protein [Phytophthora palmivora]